jgi:hypothetical protein
MSWPLLVPYFSISIDLLDLKNPIVLSVTSENHDSAETRARIFERLQPDYQQTSSLGPPTRLFSGRLPKGQVVPRFLQVSE